MEKVKNVSIMILAVMLIVLSSVTYLQFSKIQEHELQLSAFDGEIQRLNIDLGISESKLEKESELNAKYKQEISEFSEEFKKELKAHNLRLQSRDETIALLKTKIKGGTTKVVIKDSVIKSDPEKPESSSTDTEKQSISYEWKDPSNRFKLVDPDIFVTNNEEFSASQHVRILGHVFYGKDGKLQIKKIELSEVIPDGVDGKGKIKYKNAETSTVKLVDSIFEYTNNLPTQEKKFANIFKIRAIASYDSQLTPGLGVELLNIGRFVNYANIGLNTKISADLSDPLKGSLNNSRVGVGINYQFIPPLIDTNLGLGIGISTPLNDFGGKVLVTADLIYYLTN